MVTTLAANLIITDGRVLMLYRADKEYWELPAGKVEAGELPKDAAVREAQEDIGCEVRVRSPWGKFDLDFDHDGETYQARGFISEIVEGEPSLQEETFSNMAWMSEDELLDRELAPNLQQIVPELRLLLKRSV